MTPATEMKCLFCENSVPLVQSLVQRGVPFCCVGHKTAYHADTQRLMLARLMETRKRYGYARTDDGLDVQVEPVCEQVNASVPERRPKMRLQPLVTS